MPIHVPGKRDRRGHIGSAKRNVVAVLSLTAMVDMFTVLAVFLLQNYNVTGQVIEIENDVVLPNAAEVKELAPSNIVSISAKEITFNKIKIADFMTVKEQKDWEIPNLVKEVQRAIQLGEQDKKTVGNRLKKAVQQAKAGDKLQEPEIADFKKITLQADKEIDYLTIKKVMYSLNMGGIVEINFAVIKNKAKDGAAPAVGG